jgi:hypothetical protein
MTNKLGSCFAHRGHVFEYDDIGKLWGWIISHVLFDTLTRGIQYQFRENPAREQKRNPRANFGKETVARGTQEAKMGSKL